MLFGELVSKHRKARGLTKAELADAVDADEDMVNAWEAGTAVPDDTELIGRLSDALQIELGLAAVAARSTADYLAGRGGSGAESPSDSSDEPSPESLPEEALDSAPTTAEDGPDHAELETAGDADAAVPAAPSIDDPGARTLAALPTEQVEAVSAPVRTPVRSAREAVAPATQPAVAQPGSYLEDPRQMTTYWVRWILTAVGLFVLFIILIWGLGQLFTILGEIIDQITEEAGDPAASAGRRW